MVVNKATDKPADKSFAPMSFDLFKKYMDIIIHDYKTADAIYKASDRTLDTYEIFQSIGGLTDLLSIIFHDESDWIGYFIWELDCGADYSPGMVMDEQDVPVSLESLTDLYEVLVDNYASKLN